MIYVASAGSRNHEWAWWVGVRAGPPVRAWTRVGAVGTEQESPRGGMRPGGFLRTQVHSIHYYSQCRGEVGSVSAGVPAPDLEDGHWGSIAGSRTVARP